jgi:hypothetical protein
MSRRAAGSAETYILEVDTTEYVVDIGMDI